MFKFIFILLVSFLLASFKGYSKDTLLELIKENKDFSTFYELIK